MVREEKEIEKKTDDMMEMVGKEKKDDEVGPAPKELN